MLFFLVKFILARLLKVIHNYRMCVDFIKCCLLPPSYLYLHQTVLSLTSFTQVFLWNLQNISRMCLWLVIICIVSVPYITLIILTDWSEFYVLFSSYCLYCSSLMCFMLCSVLCFLFWGPIHYMLVSTVVWTSQH